MRVREESEKAGFKLNIWKIKIMASGPIISWQIEGGKSGSSDNFIFLGSKITADSDCNHEIKRFAPWKKKYDKLREHIKKQRHHFADRGPINKAMVFLVVMYKYKHWTVKEGWAPKNWSFRIVVLEKTLESPLDCKEIETVNPKGISPEYSLEGLMLKLKLQSFVHLMQRADSLEKPWCWERLKAGGEGDDRGWDGWMASLTRWTWVWVGSGRRWRAGKLVHCSPWCCKELDTSELLNTAQPSLWSTSRIHEWLP